MISNENNRVLLTGATGFIGRHCLAHLSESGREVHAVSSRPREQGGGVVRWHRADLLDRSQLSELLERVRPSHLLHLAWHMDRDLYQSRRNFEWVEASLMLLRQFADRGGRRVLMAGSSAEYDWSHGTCSEAETPLAPKTVYGACKSALGQLFTSFVRSTELSGAWPRIFFSYGPGEHPDRLVAHVVSSILQGRPARCTHGEQLRDYLYVEDAANALIAILDSELEGPVNVGSGRPTRLKDMILTIARALGREDLVELGVLPVAEDDPPLVLADVSRLANELGWTPDSSLEKGIERTIEYWRERLPEPVLGEA